MDKHWAPGEATSADLAAQTIADDDFVQFTHPHSRFYLHFYLHIEFWD
jgi:hypothetical protein